MLMLRAEAGSSRQRRGADCALLWGGGLGPRRYVTLEHCAGVTLAGKSWFFRGDALQFT